ncbi:DUF4332 domain-containing protein [Mastigocoleus sp. MO_188.B34]|uniref:DUF4332 domain-containing protein n=1 Tax=Mastigocoleus sp. MO_188.B34 TaxID=3036635 RepID=UPI002609B278|nr:DUF4332 domain-containing protein [Mastigocoleus sp. MO_188.B34]MDJ0696314.1 DUF4332 domain-containing protein [Mastigocoleus sp. MO_188.B34]
MTDESPTGNSSEERDNQQSDLTIIRGIGTVRQQLLATIGINTIADLATASVQEIESSLQAAEQVINRSEISDWILQAQELLSSSSQEVTASDNSEESNNSDRSNLIDESNVIEENNANDESNATVEDNTEEWNSLASFLVEFQSKTTAEQTEQRTVVSQQNSVQMTIWSGIETEQLSNWLQEQLNEIISPEPTSGLLEAVVGKPLRIEFEQLRVLQPPQTKVPLVSNLEIFPGSLNSNKPFVLEVAWKISGTISPEVTPYPPRYRIQAYARDRTTGRVTIIGETLPTSLVENQFSYNSVLPETSLPKGIYRLQILITLQGKLAPPAFLEVELLQVV